MRREAAGGHARASLIRQRREIASEKVESAPMPNRSILAVTSLALTALALAAGVVACEDDTPHPLPLDAGLTDIDAAPPPPADSGVAAPPPADAASRADAAAVDSGAGDGSTIDAADATAD
jgi:hypothetical protein